MLMKSKERTIYVVILCTISTVDSFVNNILISATSVGPQKIHLETIYSCALFKFLKFNTSLWRKKPECKVCEENI
jgi:hypothetical protein